MKKSNGIGKNILAVRKLVTSICTSSKEKPDPRPSLLRIGALIKKT
jgi:hypothetical protein